MGALCSADPDISPAAATRTTYPPRDLSGNAQSPLPASGISSTRSGLMVSPLRRPEVFRRFRAVDVRSIPAAGNETSQPRPVGDAPILNLPWPRHGRQTLTRSSTTNRSYDQEASSDCRETRPTISGFVDLYHMRPLKGADEPAHRHGDMWSPVSVSGTSTAKRSALSSSSSRCGSPRRQRRQPDAATPARAANGVSS